MEIVFLCIQDGKRYYGVQRNGEQIFAGTRGECDRYLDLHARKVADERLDEQKEFRTRPFAPRVYRHQRLQA